MQTGMNIGTVVDKDSLDAITKAVIEIMAQKADQETIRHGIDALARMARIEGVTIQNCVINGDRSVVVEADKAEVRERPNPQEAYLAGINFGRNNPIPELEGEDGELE